MLPTILWLRQPQWVWREVGSLYNLMSELEPYLWKRGKPAISLVKGRVEPTVSFLFYHLMSHTEYTSPCWYWYFAPTRYQTTPPDLPDEPRARAPGKSCKSLQIVCTSFIFSTDDAVQCSPWCDSEKAQMHHLSSSMNYKISCNCFRLTDELTNPFTFSPPLDFYSTPPTEGVESTRGNSVCVSVCP